MWLREAIYERGSGRCVSSSRLSTMIAPILLTSALVACAVGEPQAVIPTHDLPQLFSYNHGNHQVAVYRGAALKALLASGQKVPGFGNFGHHMAHGADSGFGEGRDGRAFAPAPAPTTPRPTLPPMPRPTLPPAPMCCASRRLSGELANMKRQLAALQASLAAMDPELMALPLC